MKRFVWRLERVLNIKVKEEQTKRVELLELTRRLAAKRGELLMRQRILENIISDIAGKIPRKRVGEQEFFLKCSTTNDKHIKKLRDHLIELESDQRRKIAEVLKIRRFKEGLEKLRAEAKRSFLKEQERLEQKELDEGAAIGFARNMIQQGKTDYPAS
ncbi:MAG: flagellar export protein FliJ [Planctomycetota bacterium]|jgi:flagellar biosynthesis chaperone FliJ